MGQLKHEDNCPCAICKTKRGENTGINHPLFGTHRSKEP